MSTKGTLPVKAGMSLETNTDRLTDVAMLPRATNLMLG